jgi:vacuolar-type H+-ATPase subunit H
MDEAFGIEELRPERKDLFVAGDDLADNIRERWEDENEQTYYDYIDKKMTEGYLLGNAG